jgi:hypothetical protein
MDSFYALYRIPGSESEQIALKRQMDAGNYVFPQDTSVHSLATLLKEWLRTLTPPLLPARFA